MQFVTNTVIGSGIGAAVSLGGQAILAKVGFTSTGVAATSVAAGVQSGIGNVAAGTTFSALQSIGATGALATAAPYVALGGGAFALLILVL